MPNKTAKMWKMAGQWLCMPLIPVLGRQRQANFWVRGQPGLQSEFQDSQSYTEKSCLEKTKKQTNKNKQKQNTKKTNFFRLEAFPKPQLNPGLAFPPSLSSEESVQSQGILLLASLSRASLSSSSKFDWCPRCSLGISLPDSIRFSEVRQTVYALRDVVRNPEGNLSPQEGPS